MIAVVSIACGCGRPTAPPGVAAASIDAGATFSGDLAPLPRYHSKRFALSLPLPDGRAWRIDDHSRPELYATHAPTHSALTVAVFRADGLVGRSQCEELARLRGLAPAGELRTLEDDVKVTQEEFDTRVWVAVQPGSGPDRPVTGYVMAFGGFLRKCFAFVFSTRVSGAGEESLLSSRLAFAQARILGGLELDPFGTVTRDAPPGREVAPAH